MALRSGGDIARRPADDGDSEGLTSDIAGSDVSMQRLFRWAAICLVFDGQ